jgi:hypothetical protein
MLLNVICGNTAERMPKLINELKTQGLEYNFWQGIHDVDSVVRSINLSHKQIVQYAKEANLESICIAEDDIQFTCPTSYQYFLKNKPQYFDLYLGGIYLGDIKEDNSVEYFTGMHLYIIHKNFYDTFLEANPNEHIDRALSNLGKYIVCNPFAAIQYNGYSANTGKSENYDSMLLDRKLYQP